MISDDGTLAPNPIMQDWETIKLHMEALNIENQNLKTDFATVLDLLTGVRKMVEEQAGLSEVAIEHSPIYQWILKIIELSHPGSIIVGEIEELRANERSIKQRLGLVLEELHLDEELVEDPIIAIDAIYTKVEDMTAWDLDNDR